MNRLVEVELRVADVERSRRFYKDLIGVPVGEIEAHSDGVRHVHAVWGEWSQEPSLLMLNIYPAEDGRTTRTNIGFAVGDIDAVHERLASAGVEVVEAPTKRPWGQTAVYRDPDGNTVSLTEVPASR